MTEQEIRSALLDALASVAPEADLAELDPKQELREQLEIDSMDQLNFVVAVHDRTGLEIPEADYPKLATLESAVAYVASRLAPAR